MFDIFNIRKCREMREVIEQLTVNLSNEHRKYDKAKELYDIAKAENSSLKLDRDELSAKVANLGRKLSEEVAKGDEFSRQVCELNAAKDKLNAALDESLARRDELSREIEKLTASNNSLKERNRFLENKIKRHNGYFDEESKELKARICDLEKENGSLKLKRETLRIQNLRYHGNYKERTNVLDSLRKHYVNHVIKTALMMCEIKESFSQSELCKIFDVGKSVLEKTKIKQETKHEKQGISLVFPASEVKRFIMESKSLREVLFFATLHGKSRRKAGDENE